MFINYSVPLCLPFFYWWDFRLLPLCKKLLLIETASLSFQLVSDLKILLTQTSSCIKAFDLKINIELLSFIYHVMFMVGYCNEFTVVQRKIIVQLYFKYNLVYHLLFHVINLCQFHLRSYHYSSSFWWSWIANHNKRKN